MMTELQTLTELFHKSSVIEAHEDGKSFKLILQEASAPTSRVEVTQIKGDFLAVNLDDNFNNEIIFSGAKGSCKRADYMLISVAQKTVVFIEMKNSKGGTLQEKQQQLSGSRCFFDYCQSILKHFFDETFISDYQLRFALFLDTRMNKKRTRPKQGIALHDSPKSPLVLKGQRKLKLEFLLNPYS